MQSGVGRHQARGYAVFSRQVDDRPLKRGPRSLAGRHEVVARQVCPMEVRARQVRRCAWGNGDAWECRQRGAPARHAAPRPTRGSRLRAERFRSRNPIAWAACASRALANRSLGQHRAGDVDRQPGRRRSKRPTRHRVCQRVGRPARAECLRCGEYRRTELSQRQGIGRMRVDRCWIDDRSAASEPPACGHSRQLWTTALPGRRACCRRDHAAGLHRQSARPDRGRASTGKAPGQIVANG